MEKSDSHTIQVKGKIILMTSVEMAQGGNAGETPIMLWVRNTNANGAWLIDQLSYGEYAFYDMKELTSILKRTFPNMTTIGDRGEPFIAQAIDILSLIHISEPTRLGMISYAVFCLKK